MQFCFPFMQRFRDPEFFQRQQDVCFSTTFDMFPVRLDPAIERTNFW